MRPLAAPHRDHRTRAVDRRLLDDLDRWRDLLANNITADHHLLTTDERDLAAHAILARILFLRIAEARGIEPHGALRGAMTADNGPYQRLLELFQRAARRHDPALLDPAAATLLTPLHLPDELLHRISGRLHDPDAPYASSVLPLAVLGSIHERSLGRTTPGRRKADGVYYTPQFLVTYLVEQTLTPLFPLKGRGEAPPQTADIRIYDPACGAGSLLLGAYEHLLAFYLDHYQERPEYHPQRVYLAHGTYRLTTAEKRRILLTHIFGMDIDRQAVELTRSSLLLRALEGAHDDPHAPHEHPPPTLADNIRCGNSLVSSNYSPPAGVLTADQQRRINPCDWRAEFPAVAASGGFSVVLGNPPWRVASRSLGEEIEYIKDRYRTATGRFDLYYCFIEESFRLLAPGGLLGMIVPNKFMHTRAAAELRAFLAEPGRLRRLIDFGLTPLFEGATTYSSIILSGTAPHDTPLSFSTMTRAMTESAISRIPKNTLSRAPWSFSSDALAEIFARMAAIGVPLHQLTERFGTGVQSGSDRVLSLTHEQVAQLGLEAPLLRGVLRGRDVRRYALEPASKSLVFPYREHQGRFILLSERELQRSPRTHAFLKAHRERLDARLWFKKTATELSGAWFGMMYLDSAAAFARPHILTPSLSDRANFSLGDGRLFATGTAGVTSILPRPALAEDIYYLLGVLNSAALSVHATAHSPAFQGGYRKFSAPFLKSLPIPPVMDAPSRLRHDRIVALVRRRLELTPRARAARLQADRIVLERECTAIEAEIDAIVNDAFGLTPAQVATLAAQRSDQAPAAPEPDHGAPD